jgi:RND family efflux transporter MFP subunit
MDAKRISIRLGQVILLIVGALLIGLWWERKPAMVLSDDAVDDLIEEVGDTYVPVHEAQIQRGTLRQYLTAYGTIEPAAPTLGQPPASAVVSAPGPAIVAQVLCGQGQNVVKGTPLFSLDSRSLDAAIRQQEQNIAADQAAIEQSRSFATTRPWHVVDQARELAGDQAFLQKLQAQRNLLTINAPIAGTITTMNLNPGSVVTPTSAAIRIIDLTRLVAAVDVPASDLGRLSVGQSATIDLSAISATTQPTTEPTAITGNVVLIDPTADPTTGMRSVDISLPANSGLVPGQLVRAKITVGEATDRLYVPTQSITQNANGDPAVGKIETDDRWAVLVPVQTGWRDGDKVEITGQGLDAGQWVVTVGANGLVQRTRLKSLKD